MKFYGIAALAVLQLLVGEKAVLDIRSREGGERFIERFCNDGEWVREFSSSGPMNTSPWRKPQEETLCAYRADGQLRYGAALRALCAIVSHDKTGAIVSLKPLKYAATALALNHGTDFSEEKLCAIMELYAQWYRDGTLVDAVDGYDVREWREVMTFGQNAPLGTDSLKWIHDFANVPPPLYKEICWQCSYRPFNCLGASVQGPDYYTPWEKELSIQELRYRIGGVCGALSKFASHAAASHGIRSVTAGQPGHCAFTVWDFKNDRWDIGYSVTAHSNPHFTLGGAGFAAVEEQDGYFRDPNRYEAERLRREGRHAESMALCKANWQAAYEWWLELKEKTGDKGAAGFRDEWNAYAEALRKCFANAPSEGWQLYMRYLRSAGLDREETIREIEKGLWAFRERTADTVERAYFDEIALNPISGLFKNDREALWTLFPAMLASQAKTPSFFMQTVDWGSKTFMADSANAKRFLAAVEEGAKASGEKLDFASMVLAASKSADIETFNQVFDLAEKFDDEEAKAKRAKAETPPNLLSAGGMLVTTSTSRWDKPMQYRSALTAGDEGFDYAFHTDSEENPAAIVILPGLSEIESVRVVNRPSSSVRQVPLEIWVSEDGKEFAQVYRSEEPKREWLAELDAPVKAKYVMVCRAAGDRKDYFHLKKIQVYGKKLY